MNAVVPLSELAPKGIELARLIARKGPIAVRCTKEAVHRGGELELGAGLALETELFGRCCASADQKEGMAAFLGKREARFTGQ